MSVERARAAAREAGLDGVIATSFESVAHLSGAPILTQRLIPDRLAAVILPVNGDPQIAVCSIETAQVQAESSIADIVDYTEFTVSPAQFIADAAEARGLGQGRIGVELRHLTAAYASELAEGLPGASFHAADDLLATIRADKQPSEVERLSAAALATDRAIASAFDRVEPGTTERRIASDIAARLLDGSAGQAADSVAFIVVAAGPNASVTHPVPTDRPLERGDVLRCDIGGYYHGYYSDIARTATVGRATEEQRSIYERLAQAQGEVIAAAVPGTPASDLFDLCREALARRGLELSLPHIGHSIGYGLHERPMLSPVDHIRLTAGMVLAIEPAVRGPGGVFHIEDMVEVTVDGGRPVSRSRGWDVLWEIGA